MANAREVADVSALIPALWSTTSGRPPFPDVTTGQLHAIASAATIPNRSSRRVGTTRQSIDERYPGRSRSLREPKRTAPEFRSFSTHGSAVSNPNVPEGPATRSAVSGSKNSSQKRHPQEGRPLFVR